MTISYYSFYETKACCYTQTRKFVLFNFSNGDFLKNCTLPRLTCNTLTTRIAFRFVYGQLGGM